MNSNMDPPLEESARCAVSDRLNLLCANNSAGPGAVVELWNFEEPESESECERTGGMKLEMF